MDKTCGQHYSVTLELINKFSKRNPDRAIEIYNIPRYAELVENGIGHYYHDPGKANKANIYYE